MRCFNHPDVESIGTCKVCQKGLCHDCAIDLDHSIACKGKHEAEAEAFNSLVRRNIRVQGTAGKIKYVAPVFYAFMGAVFLVFGLRDESRAGGFPIYLGAGFLIFAVVLIAANRRAYGVSSRDRS